MAASVLDRAALLKRAAARADQVDVARLEARAGPGSLLFRNGMAAISAVLLMLEKMLGPRFTLETRARYFETLFLQTVLGCRAGATVQFLESVTYDWELSVLEASEVRAPIVVLDTTLTGDRLVLERPDVLVIRVFSALKLHQLGLELENAGVVSARGPGAEECLEWLRQAREATGTAHSQAELRRLDVDFFLDPDATRRHCDAVFENNAWLARQLRPGGIVSRVVHPALGDRSHLPWACSPFVVLHLASDTIEDHQVLTAALEAESRGLDFGRGASFGFQGHRHEYVVPRLAENRALFKVAMGAGPGREAVADVLGRLLAFPSMDALRRAYPGLEPAPPPRDWAGATPALIQALEQPF